MQDKVGMELKVGDFIIQPFNRFKTPELKFAIVVKVDNEQDELTLISYYKSLTKKYIFKGTDRVIWVEGNSLPARANRELTEAYKQEK